MSQQVSITGRTGFVSIVLKFRYWGLILFILGIAYRIYTCFQVPLISTDVWRNLGYASHALENRFTIYNTKAIDFQPEIWSSLWSNLTYPYPPVTLLFFYLFSRFHAGIFWVKLILNLIELICAYLFYKRVSQVAAILFFLAPISIWFTSHEGQFEALQTLFIILNVIAIKNKNWRLAGFLLALSIQVKQMGLLIVPWMVYEVWQDRIRDSFPSLLLKILQGFLLGFLPFLGYYLQTPFLLLQPFLTIRDLIKDPMNPFTWNALNLSYAPLIILASMAISKWKKVELIVSVVPLASFWCIMKSLKVARAWYAIVSPGFLFCFLQEKKLIYLLLVLHLIQGLRSNAVIVLGEPFGILNNQQIPVHIGYRETEQTRQLMKYCMFTCNMKQDNANQQK